MKWFNGAMATFGRPCFCGRERSYPLCCQPIVESGGTAETAEDLMRSRYSAYCTGAHEYLLRSWDPNTRPSRIGDSPGQKWLGLEILDRQMGSSKHQTGTVEFVARFSDKEGLKALHEVSNFRRFEGRWVYTDGVHKG